MLLFSGMMSGREIGIFVVEESISRNALKEDFDGGGFVLK